MAWANATNLSGSTYPLEHDAARVGVLDRTKGVSGQWSVVNGQWCEYGVVDQSTCK